MDSEQPLPAFFFFFWKLWLKKNPMVENPVVGNLIEIYYFRILF